MNLLINIAQAHSEEEYFGHHMTFSGTGFGFFGWIWMLLFWVLVIAGIIYLIKSIASTQDIRKENTKSIDILKERYAKGEIDKKEFEEKKKELE
jgi:putative membrane protein